MGCPVHDAKRAKRVSTFEHRCALARSDYDRDEAFSLQRKNIPTKGCSIHDHKRLANSISFAIDGVWTFHRSENWRTRRGGGMNTTSG